MTGKDSLVLMSTMDELLEHDIETCGMCFHRRLMAEVARELIATNDPSWTKWDREVSRRWRDGKFYKLWQEAKAKGVDPHTEFEARGWEP